MLSTCTEIGEQVRVESFGEDRKIETRKSRFSAFGICGGHSSRLPARLLYLSFVLTPLLLFVHLQIGVPIDPACLYGTSPPLSRQEPSAEGALADGVDVNEEDLGGFSQLSVVEGMLDRGQGLQAGLQGVAMTR